MSTSTRRASPPLLHVPALLLLAALGCQSASTGGEQQPPPPGARVGEELLFLADDLVAAAGDTLPDPLHARYLWTFGDDRGPGAEARSATYAYGSPGTFTVRLEVTPATHAGDGGTPANDDDDTWTFADADTRVYTQQVTVTGTAPPLAPVVPDAPLLAASFDGSLASTGAALAWRDDARGAWVNGYAGQGLDLSGGAALVVDPATLVQGRGELTVSFRSRRTALDAEASALVWQGTANTYQPVIRFLIGSEGTTELLQLYTLSSAGANTAAFNLGRDLAWHHYAFTYSASAGRARIYRDGALVAEKAVSGALAAGTTPLLLGHGEVQTSAGLGQHHFRGVVDDLRVYGRELSGAELSRAFAVRHADFHGHVAQPILVEVPDAVVADAGARLRATVSGGALGSPLVLLDQTGLDATTRLVLRNAELPGSPADYALQVEVRDGQGSVLFTQREPFRKTHDGPPRVGVDENGAVCLDGVPFFPVTPWGLNDADVGPWVEAGYVNAMYGQGFWPGTRTVAGYQAYLDAAGAAGVGVIGPASWDGMGTCSTTGPPATRSSAARRWTGCAPT
ncbi:MAG: PKD domain-containing protein [Anaeromyxobacter sp.]